MPCKLSPLDSESVPALVISLSIGLHCKENRIYVFLFWELRGLCPNCHIHVSVGDFYIPRIGPNSRIGRLILEIYTGCGQ